MQKKKNSLLNFNTRCSENCYKHIFLSWYFPQNSGERNKNKQEEVVHHALLNQRYLNNKIN